MDQYYKLIVFVCLLPQLAYISYTDLKFYKIYNYSNIIMAATFIFINIIFSKYNIILTNITLSFLIIILLFYPFVKGLIGGGDVKFLASALLWTGIDYSAAFAVYLALSIFLYLGLLYMGLVSSLKKNGKTYVPFGPIGAAAMILALISGF